MCTQIRSIGLLRNVFDKAVATNWPRFSGICDRAKVVNICISGIVAECSAHRSKWEQFHFGSRGVIYSLLTAPIACLCEDMFVAVSKLAPRTGAYIASVCPVYGQCYRAI